MAIKSIKSEKFHWYYLTGFASEELLFLKKNFKFHPLDLKDCAGEIQRSKIDVYKDYLFLVIQFPHIEKTKRKIEISQVYFFIGKDYLITISHDKFKFLNNFFYKFLNSKKFQEESFSQDSGYLLYKILDDLLRNSWITHGYLDEEIRRVETAIDEGRSKKSVFDIAFLRRIILQLKAIVDAQKMVTNSLSRFQAKFLNKEILVYFDDIDDYVEKNWLIVESQKDRILTLQEINESLISYRTNQIIKVLTTFSVALMPLTLLSGIYGMNIELPLSHSPHFVWLLFSILSIFILGVFLYLKKKDWF
ncbi:magnesium transporter CorA family protein [Candidatus Falkowbacteria bacterium]|nr:magnesium transporter CorA family protein [Candidatus Falkowbacteria bacterium]